MLSGYNISEEESVFNGIQEVNQLIDGLLDIHICGACRAEFNNLEEFLQHKRQCRLLQRIQQLQHRVRSKQEKASRAAENAAGDAEPVLRKAVEDVAAPTEPYRGAADTVTQAVAQQLCENETNSFAQYELVIYTEKESVAVEPTSDNADESCSMHVMVESYSNSVPISIVTNTESSYTITSSEALAKAQSTVSYSYASPEIFYSNVNTDDSYGLAKVSYTAGDAPGAFTYANNDHQQRHAMAVPSVGTVLTPLVIMNASVGSSTAAVVSSDGNSPNIAVPARESIGAPRVQFGPPPPSLYAAVNRTNVCTTPGRPKRPVEVSAHGSTPPLNAYFQKSSTSSAPNFTPRFVCTHPNCTYSTSHTSDLSRHQKTTHSDQRPFECTNCHILFKRRDQLLRHAKIHSGEKPYKCKSCNYATGDKSTLNKHMRRHSALPKRFRCQVCPFSCHEKNRLDVHLRTHTGDSPYQCQLCPKSFKTKSNYQRHQRSHSGAKPFKCEFCNFQCNVKSNLRSHVNLNHASSAGLKSCNSCAFATRSLKIFREHVKIHTPQLYEKCPHCELRFRKGHALSRHLRTHNDRKPFTCSYCQFTTKYRGSLDHHTQVHHTEKYESAAYKKASQKACAKVTAGGVRKLSPKSKLGQPMANCRQVFVCEVCSESFVRLDSYRCHKKQHFIT